MSHEALCHIDVDQVIEEKPLVASRRTLKLLWFFVLAGAVVFLGELYRGEMRRFAWNIYYLNLCFWFGLAAGCVAAALIFQMVRAGWAPPLRRIAEANLAFFPPALLLLMLTWFGREDLFAWARGKLHGLEWWMSPGFVYARFAVLFLILSALMGRFVFLSLRADIGLIRERKPDSPLWKGRLHHFLTRNWRGSKGETPLLQDRMSKLAPVAAVAYVIVFSLFAFEMIKGMVPEWPSTLFGAHIFIGNIYMAWAVLAVLAVYLARNFSAYDKVLGTQQLWDLGKLCLGFSMVWADFVFCQFLIQWYGNIPIETEWMGLRTRLEPWKWVAWAVLSLGFVIPFVLLLSRDLKKTPWALTVTCLLILGGLWLEKYLIMLPIFSADRLPLSGREITATVMITLGFAGLYLLSLQSFLRRVPFVPLVQLKW